MRKTRTIAGLIAIVFAISMWAGCASLVKNSAATLSASNSLYHIAMETVVALQNEGVLTLDDRVKINDLARKYKNAHNLAVDALLIYAATKDAADEEKLQVALAQAIASWADLAALINSFEPGALPSEIGGV